MRVGPARPKCRSLQNLEVRALKYRRDGWQTGGRTFVYLASGEEAPSKGGTCVTNLRRAQAEHPCFGHVNVRK